MTEKKIVHIGPFRVDPKNKRLIERAARIERRSVSDFIRLAALDKAAEVIEAEKMRREK